jgi:hypothetical protein
MCTELAKQCAIILVEEMIENEPRYPNDTDWDDCGGTHEYYYEAQREDANKFWNDVRHELLKSKLEL